MANGSGGGRKEWGKAVPPAPGPSAFGDFRREILAERDAAEQYRAQVLADLDKLAARIMKALHYFGTAGVPESSASLLLRQTDRDKWWVYMDQFFDILEVFGDKLEEAYTLRLRVTFDPCDLPDLVRAFLRPWQESEHSSGVDTDGADLLQ